LEKTILEGRREEVKEGCICRGLAGHRILTFKQERERASWSLEQDSSSEIRLSRGDRERGWQLAPKIIYISSFRD
jgi:hypothetical protein